MEFPCCKAVHFSHHISISMERVFGVTVHVMLVKGQYTDQDKSVLIRAGVKLDHLDTYAGVSDLKEFKVFIAGIFIWLKMNCLIGETSTDMCHDSPISADHHSAFPSLAFTLFTYVTSQILCHSHQFTDAVLIGSSHQPLCKFCSHCYYLLWMCQNWFFRDSST